MQENFLHYVWQFQYFDKVELKTTSGETLTIFHPGFRNSNAGPDFLNARIRIGDIEWVGNVEIHLHSSAWQAHHHHVDKGYDNVILHVVWKDNVSVRRMDGSLIPTIELQHRVDEALVLRYQKLNASTEVIPCASGIADVNHLTKLSQVEKAVLQRLEAKASEVSRVVSANNNDWEESCYQLLARNFGFKVNSEPFLQLAKGLPYRVLMKHGDQLTQLEALLFGQAGLLDEVEDAYPQLLKREHALLSHKFNLGQGKLHHSQWKFLRLRPANFPTVRLAQFAALLFERKNLFASIIACEGYTDLVKIFSVEQSEYWKHHYTFKKMVREVFSIGKTSIDNIIINTLVPLLVAYGRSRDDQSDVDRAVAILQATSAEENKITKLWQPLGMACENAFDSQGLIELYNNFCLRRRCLDCSIGATLVRPLT